MLTRLYIDNFRCFVNFEYNPSRKELIFGPNGSGKSSLLDAVLFLRQIAVAGVQLDGFFILAQRTRWMNQKRVVHELQADLDGRYVYRLVIEPSQEHSRPLVASETVHFEGKPVFEFEDGKVHTYNDRFEQKVTYDFDPTRSALATLTRTEDNATLTRFKQWISKLYCFRINPFAIDRQRKKRTTIRQLIFQTLPHGTSTLCRPSRSITLHCWIASASLWKASASCNSNPQERTSVCWLLSSPTLDRAPLNFTSMNCPTANDA